MCFGQKSKTTTTTKQETKHLSFSETGIEPGTSRTPVRFITSGPTSQLNIPTEIKLLNCISVICRNLKKESHTFLNIIACCCCCVCVFDNIWQFLIFTGVEFTA